MATRRCASRDSLAGAHREDDISVASMSHLEEEMAEDDTDIEEEHLWPRLEPSIEPVSQASAKVPVVMHRITTLQQRLRTPTDFVDLSGSVCHLQFPSSDSVLKIGYNTFGSTELPLAPFPPVTHGFFYCVIYPGYPLATEFRFRITQPDMPESFKYGYHLLRNRGLPWNIPLLAMIKDQRAFAPLINLMKSDNLIPQSLTLHRSGYALLMSSFRHASTVIRSFGRPFVYSFTNRSPKVLWVVGQGVISPLSTNALFQGSRIGPVSLPEGSIQGLRLTIATPQTGQSAHGFGDLT